MKSLFSLAFAVAIYKRCKPVSLKCYIEGLEAIGRPSVPSLHALRVLSNTLFYSKRYM